ncbi:hypothetical protein Tco_1158521, partial [Tanacetum coccineum]
NMVAFLEKSSGSAGFHQVIDFLNRSHICYALTKKPDVYISFIKQFWRSAEASTDDNGDVQITATIDGYSLSFTEGYLRRHLKLDDQDGITSIPNSEIFEQLALMGYHTDSDKLTFQKGAFSPQWSFHIFIHDHIPIQDQGSSEKGSAKISTSSATKGTASEVPVVSTVEEDISTAGRTITYSRRSEEKRTRKDKGKAIMTESEPKKKSKKEIEQERLSFAKAIRLEEQMNEEQRAQIARDEEIANRQ